MADLFEPDQLQDALQQGPLNEPSVLIARRVASGWLRAATELAEWPDPTPDDLFGWALELAGLFYNNPEGLASDTVGGTSAAWDRQRRAEILGAARAAYANVAGGRGGPVGAFPAPLPGPDWYQPELSRPYW
ncbi:hypothetical protein [Winogradskya humida]|uniref:Uncharacterized protein n=1 Tax=Winogradskya humida TaxID=113566 RepID=A0ABQ4A755_9ACTN|nr:hypothetical protein [Actinoplanes humidus]GIE26690.1 hypothetical protein Ahu01nite_097920 [Actinoplanes humidus]